MPLLQDGERVINVSSASGPMFMAKCSAERQRQLTNADITWEQVEGVMKECLAIAADDGDYQEGDECRAEQRHDVSLTEAGKKVEFHQSQGG